MIENNESAVESPVRKHREDNLDVFETSVIQDIEDHNAL